MSDARGSALLVHWPGIGMIAATDDAIVAGDIVDLGIGRDDRQTVDLALERAYHYENGKPSKIG
jgi:hypothetical protein